MQSHRGPRSRDREPGPSQGQAPRSVAQNMSQEGAHHSMGHGGVSEALPVYGWAMGLTAQKPTKQMEGMEDMDKQRQTGIILNLLKEL